MRNVTALLAAGLLTIVGGIAIGQQYQEAPWFAEMVARGELLPVAERLPLEPRRISPDDEFNTYETGRYSDRWVDVVAGSVEETQGLTGEARAGREDQEGNISPWSFKGWGGQRRQHGLDLLHARRPEVVRRRSLRHGGHAVLPGRHPSSGPSISPPPAGHA